VTGAPRRRVPHVPLEAGAVVMATGIVSTALELDGRAVVSDALLALCALGWLGLAFARGRAGRPASLTIVAATCVLGTRLTMEGWRAAGVALLVAGAALLVPLSAAVLRGLGRPVAGSAFLVVVAAQAVAVLAAELGAPGAIVVPPQLVALGLYAYVVRGFDLGEVVRGRGDQWIAGGALAISALAAAETGGSLGPASLVLWAAAMLWLPVLVWGELRRPWRGFDMRRWSTVFPLGMYAVMSFAVGGAEGRRWIVWFARAWTWVAVAAFALTAAATLADLAREPSERIKGRSDPEGREAR
jgi:hypothetical protein